MNENIMRSLGFGDHVDHVKAGLCPFCKKQIDPSEFRTELDRREWKISGICQSCQDKTFTEPEEEHLSGDEPAF